ncbi:Regulator of G protein signaling superfamily [Penicillium crustosum]|uniref:Regulator of G protein signaling superfamily n=1 Tax=Penicillium crustosum TaxID=36656 RepID=UPI0023951010|nr:Regulator of G protein signaling superfamily [Penicillium crustosum]KAJ5402807.1 Regulator of G protein signaling superfamily [Penicillium crustosum]
MGFNGSLFSASRHKTIEILDGESHDILANIPYHFQWEGSIGLIKIVPNNNIMANSDLSRLIDMKNYLMGPDNAFVPSSHRVTSTGLSRRWPTLVIEAGVPGSLPRLRLNAKDWFVISDGQVRIVLLIGITNSEITFEKWQLAPTSAPHPLMRESIGELYQQNPNIPPLIGPPASGQQAYSAQEVSYSSLSPPDLLNRTYINIGYKRAR